MLGWRQPDGEEVTVADLDMDLRAGLPPRERDEAADEAMARALREAFDEAVENARTGKKSWTDRTGKLSSSFDVNPTDDGAVMINHQRYSGAVVEFRGAPPLRVLMWMGIQELAAQKLEERGDEVATALLHEVMAPLLRLVRREEI